MIYKEIEKIHEEIIAQYPPKIQQELREARIKFFLFVRNNAALAKMSRYKIKRKVNFDLKEVKCPKCSKLYKGMRSLKCHISHMHSGLKNTKNRGRPKGIPAWNIGLDRNNDNRVEKYSNSIKRTVQEKIKNGTFVINKMGESARKKLSEEQALRNRGGKCRWFEVNGIKVQGTWEYNVALKLNELGVEWSKPKTNSDLIKYEINGKIKSYAPDFFLPKYNVYLEIKGYWWGNDVAKMAAVIKQHPEKKILIIEKDSYKRLLQGELVW